MRLTDLTGALRVQRLLGTADKDVKALKYRSDKCEAGDAFFALRGRDADGHDFIADAAARGAQVIFVEDVAACASDIKNDPDLTIVEVPDTRQALALTAAAFYRYPARELLTVGITGTKGKTTTAFLLQAIFEAAGMQTGIIGTVHCGYEEHYHAAANTTPESCELQRLLREMADGGCKAVVMEVSSQGLKFSRVAGIPFDYALFTNLSPDHIGIGEHRDFAEYTYWKSRLFSQCETAVLHDGDPAWASMAAHSSAKKKIFFGITGSAHSNDTADSGAAGESISAADTVHACEVRLFRAGGRLGSAFRLQDGADFVIGLPGLHNVENALGAIAVARDLGIADDVIRQALRTVFVPGRTETVDIGPDRIALVDYAHNGVALQHLLETLRTYEPRRLLLVFGCGGERAPKRRTEMGRVAAQMADLCIVTSDNPRREDPLGIIGDITAAMDAAGGGSYQVIADRREAIRTAVQMTGPGDMLVVAGKGHETDQIIGTEVRHFDDREELRKGRRL